MAAGNQVTITGNATKDAELRETQGGTSVCSFGIANNRKWKDSNDEWQEEPGFYDIVAWSHLAENVAGSVRKGDRVTITGRLQYRQWEDRETQAKRSKVEIVADDVAMSLRYGVVTDFEKNERQDYGDNQNQDRGQGNDGYDQQSGYEQQAPSGRGGGQQQAPQGRGRGQQAPQQQQGGGRGGGGGGGRSQGPAPRGRAASAPAGGQGYGKDEEPF